MIDIWLSMNSCIRDKEDNIFFIELNKEPKLLGRLKGHTIKNHTIHIDVQVNNPINFINVKVNVDWDGVTVE